MDFNKLIHTLSEINSGLKEQCIRAVNLSLTLRNWLFGFYIFEFEQRGKDRAEYAKALLARIAAELKSLSIPNTDERELRRFRQFCLAYSMVAQFFKNNLPIRGLLISELIFQEQISKEYPNRGLPNPRFEINDNLYSSLFLANHRVCHSRNGTKSICFEILGSFTR